jgi:hypothetical protein
MFPESREIHSGFSLTTIAAAPIRHVTRDVTTIVVVVVLSRGRRQK